MRWSWWRATKTLIRLDGTLMRWPVGLKAGRSRFAERSWSPRTLRGNATVVDTGNHLGRKGAAWGAGVGLAVGLFSPALLASAAVGAVAGALAVTFGEHRLKTGLHDKIGQALTRGTGVVIAVLPESSRLAAEQTLAGSLLKSIAELEHSTLRSLGGALAEAMAKFNPIARGCRFPTAPSAARWAARWRSRSVTGQLCPAPRRPTAHQTC
jgi:uncharacterized membrane protein